MYTDNNDARTVHVDKKAILIQDIEKPSPINGEGFCCALYFISVRSFRPGVFPDPLRSEVRPRPLFLLLQDPEEAAVAAVQEVLLPVPVSDSEQLPHWVKV